MDKGTVREAFQTVLELFVNRKPERILFTTFNFNPPFFENNILAILAGGVPGQMPASALNKALAGTEIAVFCDRTASPFPKRDVRYALVPVGLAGGRFHPKIIVAEGILAGTGNPGVAVIVASANLTLAGWGQNREVAGWTLVCSKHVDELVRLLDWLKIQCTFLEENKVEDGLDMTAFFENLKSVVFEAPSDGAAGAPDFLMALPDDGTSTLLARMKGGGAYDSLTVLSPYWGSVPGIVKACGAASIDFIPSLEKDGYSFPRTSLAGTEASYRYSRLPLDDDSRFSHGKLYLWRGPSEHRLAVGSANCTGPALLGEGNVEAMLVYHATGKPKDAFSLATVSLSADKIHDREVGEEGGAIPLLPFEVMVVRDWNRREVRCHFKVFKQKTTISPLLSLPGLGEYRLGADQWESPCVIACHSKRRINAFQIKYEAAGAQQLFKGVVIDLNASPVDLGFERRESLNEVLEDLHLKSRDGGSRRKGPNDGDSPDAPGDDEGETGDPADEEESTVDEGTAYDFFALYQGFLGLRKEIAKEGKARDYLGSTLQRILRALLLDEDSSAPAQIRRYLVLAELSETFDVLPGRQMDSTEGRAFVITMTKEFERSQEEIMLLLSKSDRFKTDLIAAGSFLEWFEKEIRHEL